MKEKQILRKNVVQMIRAAILQVEKDKQIELDDNQVLEIINTTVGTNNSGNNSDKTETTPVIPDSSFKPVLVQVGQTIYGKEGTELILRSGKGNAVVPGKEGIANITNGMELKNKNTVNKNQLLIIPRDDGRGIKVTEKAWFLVKGGYSIK